MVYTTTGNTSDMCNTTPTTTIPIWADNCIYPTYPWYPEPYNPFSPQNPHVTIIPQYVTTYEYVVVSNFPSVEKGIKFKDRGNDVQLKLNLPGFDKKEVEISVNTDRVTVVANNTDGSIIEEYQLERDMYNYDDSTSELKNGVLTIIIPKFNKNKPKTIPIS